ncbi:TlpA family protein disulfide reductase [Flavobacterium sp.]|uniref:TlpA family protein disulfide reductase n=1 Tax=Flavobacterium sp. TaxID=239 RepID=UPI003527CFF2
MKQQIIFLALTLILFLLNVFTGLIGVKFQFIFIGLVNFIFCIYLLNINPYKKIGWGLIFIYPILGLFLLIHSILYDVDGYRGLLIDLICVVSSVFAILVHKRKKYFFLSYILIFIVLSFNFDNLNNYYLDKVDSQGYVNVDFPDIVFEDFNKKPIKLPANKVLVLDLWTTHCEYCIESFPKFEKLEAQYKNDKEIAFFSINIYEDYSEKEKSLQFLKGFKFKNYYHDISLFEKLNFNSVPNYVVINKNGLVTYFGSLNDTKFETYNNIHNIIKDAK